MDETAIISFEEERLDDECLFELLNKEDFDLPLELIEEELLGEDDEDEVEDSEFLLLDGDDEGAHSFF